MVERDVIDTITVKFKDIEGKIKSRIIFSINWEKLELLAKNDDGEILYQGTDFSSNLSKQLDKKLYDALKVFVNRTKKKHNIEKVDCSFSYREKYLKTEEIHNATREYMDHIKGKIEYFANDNQEFEHEIKTFFQGLDDILGITFDC